MDKPELDWIEEFELRTVRDAAEFLREVKLQLERGGGTEARISASGYKGDFRLRVGDEEPMIEERLRLAQMLERKHIIQEVTLRRGGGSPYASAGDEMIVRADLAVAREALGRMAVRMSHRFRPPAQEPKAEEPATPASPPAPRAVASTDEISRRTHAEERARFPYALALGVGIPLILGILAFLFTPLGNWLKARYLPKTPDTIIAPDTTGKKTPPHL